MKYINISGLTKPNSWLRDSRRHNRIVKKIPNFDKKLLYINGQSSFWGKFKSAFEKISKERCWFTESPDWVSPFHIEHFRPKGRIDPLRKDLGFTEFQRTDWNIGYWWLAFNWKNYRLACFALNTSYKRNYFPLEQTSLVTTVPTVDHRAEKCVLIDPCVPSDVDLITYNMWEAIPTADPLTDLRNYERARISIRIYGLNEHVKLVEARKGVLKVCNKLLQNANDKFEHLKTIPNINSHEFARTFKYFNDDCELLRDMINFNEKGALFPTMIINRIESSGYEWVDDFVING